MATFHINRGGTNLGTFSEDEVRDGLRSGKFFGTDLGLARRDGNLAAACANFRIRAGNRARCTPAHRRNSLAALLLLGRQSPRAPVCRGMIGSKKDFSPHLSKRCKLF